MSPSDAPGAPAAVRAILDRYPTEDPAVEGSGAAVLAILREGRAVDEVEVLLIQRAVRAEDRASGQVGLPGGRVHPGDPSLRATALRETEEEVGLDGSDLLEPLRFIGRRMAPAFGLEVGVFAASLAPDAREPFARDPSEVASVFWAPRRAMATTVSVPAATSFGSRPVEAAVHDGHVVWGFTRRILRDLFELEGPGGRSSRTGP